MSNIPENKQNEQAEEVFSTIFSDPSEHRKIKPQKNKTKPFVKIIAFCLSLVVLIGSTIAVIKLIPERQEEDDFVPIMDEIEIINLESDTFKTVTFQNQNGRFEFFSEAIENADTASSETSAVNWFLKGYDEDVISSPFAEEKIKGISLISAIRKIEQKNDIECGLDNPLLTAEIVTDESTLKLSLGSASPDKTGYYFKLSNKNEIYLVSEEVKSKFEFSALDLANTDVLKGLPLTEDMTDYMDDKSDLSTFDTLTVSGKNFSNNVVIVPNPEDSLLQYAVSSPIKRRAQNADYLIGAFKDGITVSGAYSLDVSDSSLKKFGLDNPDFIMTMNAGKITHTFKFALQEDGNYAAVCTGEKLIKKVSADSLTYAAFEETDFYSNWVCMEYLAELKGMKFKTPDNSYDFSLNTLEKENEKTETTVTYNGKTINTEKFTKLYEECLNLTCTSFETEKLSASPDYSIIFEFSDGSSKTYDFIKSGATKYQYRENGTDMGKVNSSSLNKVITELGKLVK